MWRPTISVIIPVYNGAAFLRAAIDSVLSQTCPPAELIVVDDGSTDDSAHLVADLVPPSTTRLTLAGQPNLGPAAARNHGLSVATGELVAFLDADDLWLPQKLELQVGYLAAHDECAGVVAHMATFLEPGAAWPSGRNRAYYDLCPPAYNFSTLLIRGAVFDQVGWLDPSLRTGEDSDWFFRARDAGINLGVVPEVLLRRRFHSSNLSSSSAANSQQMLDIIRASVSRRRHDG